MPSTTPTQSVSGRATYLVVLAVLLADCHDRELVGYGFALRSRAREAERALEAACISRFGTLRPTGTLPVIRSDNGLIF